MVLDDGLVVVGPAASNNLWFRIQAIAVMDMMHAMRWVHHWGAPTADHLFEYTCAPMDVKLAPKNIRYSVSCPAAVETLKITFTPTAVTAGGQPLEKKQGAAGAAAGDWYRFDEATGLLTVAHAAHGTIAITG